MKQTLFTWLESLGLPMTQMIGIAIILAVIALTALAIHILLHRGVLRFLETHASRSQGWWQNALFRYKLFTRLALILQALILQAQARIWLNDQATALPIIEMAIHLWVVLFSLLSLFSLMDTAENLLLNTSQGRRLPVRGIFQGVKLTGSILAIVYAVSVIVGRSPAILLSGLGAMTAVLLLVFKDSILGLVAGIQLSANDMLSVGDWLEMPKYGADGDVVDINLTTVKVCNWDKTITTIPTYALISDSFKNWRGMSEAGGRRIKRSIHIDATSVRFLDEADITRLRRAQLLSGYIENKLREIKKYNEEHACDPSSPVNGRRLTNLGTFRAYIAAYIKADECIHPGMTQMVRQLASGSEGIPLEVYAFSSNTAWVAYEGIQADIFDHIFAVLPEFDLRVYQNPTGHDLRNIMHDTGAETAELGDSAGGRPSAGTS